MQFAKSFRQNALVYLALCAIVFIALIIRVAYAVGNPTLDDAFITFRYVRNLARGLGFVFNPGERILGTTTPFYALLLVPFEVAGADIISVGKAINVLASTAGVVLVFLIARRAFGDYAALLSAMLSAISTSNVWAASTGMETELNVLILLALAYVYLLERYSLAALLAAIALVTRPDDLILVGIIFAWHVVKMIGRRRRAEFLIRPLITFLLCMLPWLIFAMLYFGSPIPTSIMGKVASYRVPVTDNLNLYFNQFGFALSNWRAIVTTGLFFLGLIGIFRRRDDLITLPVYFLFYSAAFVFSGARLGSGWYWQPLWPVYSIIVAGSVSLIGEVVQKSRMGTIVEKYKLPIVVAIVMAVALFWTGALKARFVDPRPADDLEWAELAAAGRWLEQNTAPNATVGLETIGAVGWYSDRYIVDEGGLVSPQVATINQRLGRPDFSAILRTFQPDYYLAWIRGELDAINAVPEQREWFAQHYQPIASFDVGIGRTPYFILFRKTAD